jgi:Tfp pilus assembly protein PilN
MSSAPVGVVTGSDIPGPNLALLATMPRVDLMPPEMAEGEALKRLKLGCLASLVACCAAVGGVWLQAHSTIADARTNLAKTQTEQTGVRQQVAKLAFVEAQFSAAQQGKALIQQALGGEVRWSTQLRNLSMTIPDNVWLETMVVGPGGAAASGTAAPGTSTTATTGTTTTTGAAAPAAATPATPTSNVATITFTGTAASRYDVARWLDTLAATKGYVGATYTTSSEQVIGTQVFVNFNSTVQLTTDVLSGRYTNQSGS